MIPKIIHYCWFGGHPLPELAKKCMASWKAFFPNYEIKEWNETNYDVHKILYTSEAYGAKKYAFVSDYARFDILYQHGGIYFDIDVEVVRPFDDILINGGFMGLESKRAGRLGLSIGCNAGLGMGCNAELNIIHQILEYYKNLHFLNKDGSFNLKTVVEYVTMVLKMNGLREEDKIQILDGLVIYPTEYFCPMSFESGKLNITENTYSIHHYDASWTSMYQKEYDQIKKNIYNRLGYKIGQIVIWPHFLLWQVKEHGFKKTLMKIIAKIKTN